MATVNKFITSVIEAEKWNSRSTPDFVISTEHFDSPSISGSDTAEYRFCQSLTNINYTWVENHQFIFLRSEITGKTQKLVRLNTFQNNMIYGSRCEGSNGTIYLFVDFKRVV